MLWIFYPMVLFGGLFAMLSGLAMSSQLSTEQEKRDALKLGLASLLVGILGVIGILLPFFSH